MPREPSPGELRRAEAQVRVARALTLMREGRSATGAAEEAGTTLRTMRRHAGRALRRAPSGQYVAAKEDRLHRRMRVLTAAGLAAIDAPGSKAASEIAGYWAAVQRYLRTGDDGPLRAFRRKRAGRGRQALRFVTDPDTIERLALAGEVEFEDLYESRT